MSKEYGLHPALTWGVDPLAEPLLAYQLLRATFYGGRAVENRLRQTKPALAPNREDAPKGSHWTEAPIWSYAAAVGLEPPPEDANDEASDEAIADRALRRHELEPETADLIRGLIES